MKKYLLFLMVIVCSATSFAQDVKRPESCNYQRGIESIKNKDYEEGIGYQQQVLRITHNK